MKLQPSHQRPITRSCGALSGVVASGVMASGVMALSGLVALSGCTTLLGGFERIDGLGGGGAGGSGGAGGKKDGPCGYGCDGLLADCDGDLANGFEADLSSDPANCGACGIACVATSCNDGACPPVTIWTGAEQPRELHLDETLAYFLLSQSVIGMTKDGVAQSSYSQTEVGPQSLALDSENLYWVATGSSEIRRIAKTGGAPSSLHAEPFVDRVAVDGGALYWTTTGDPNAGTPYQDGTVKMASLDGTGVTPLATSQSHPLAIAARAGRVAWSTSDPVDGCVGEILLLEPGAPSPEPIGSVAASGLELTGDTLVYPEVCGVVKSLPLAGGALVDHGNLPYALEGNLIYGTFYDAGLATPLWSPPNAQTVVDVVDTAATAGVMELAVDATSFYYSSTDELGAYVIRRIEKPFGLRELGGCALGTADCNGQPDDGCEVSLWTDPDHCGACGRSCGGAACETRCVPTEAYLTASVLLGGAADDTNLYVTETGGVSVLPLAGGPPKPLTQSVSPSAGIALDGTSAYIANLNTQIVEISLADGSTSVLGAAPGAVAIVANGGEVFWAGGSTVGKIPTGGGAPTTLATMQDSPGGLGPSGLAVDSDSVYWTTGLDTATAAIRKTGRDGGPVVAIASGLQGPLTIALDGSHLYWSEGSEGIFRANLDGTEAKRLSWSNPFVRGLIDDWPTSLTVDATHIYWGTQLGGVLQVQKSGGPPGILAGYLTSLPSFAVVAGQKVFWGDSTGVWSTPKL